MPIFEKHAKIEEKKRQDKFLRVEIDGDTNPLLEEYSARYVRVVPAVILFERAYGLKRLDGTVGLGGSEKQLRDFLDTCTV